MTRPTVPSDDHRPMLDRVRRVLAEYCEGHRHGAERTPKPSRPSMPVLDGLRAFRTEESLQERNCHLTIDDGAEFVVQKPPFQRALPGMRSEPTLAATLRPP